MTRFAKNTHVPISQSQAEIQSIVEKYGATEFGFMKTVREIGIAFTFKERAIRILMKAFESGRMPKSVFGDSGQKLLVQ